MPRCYRLSGVPPGEMLALRQLLHTSQRRDSTMAEPNGSEEESKPIEFYEDEENLKKLCNFLRSKEGAPVREAVQMDTRVYYFKGECFVPKPTRFLR